ncbi:hypothetical protein MKK58_26725 [Methylobacterium sp. J-078]|uniref:hypothetical protein n=1 Tax=Methylobacterium sp. J-078 TaxID=2836657 RepID=UPI001FBAA90A|nr:hypothetical protein [Methylobacterium sp. J-078]MCJ2048106.1 hypothetical protein [Methylobacterium sp. J-078]
MSDDPLAARGLALEDLFFAREEAASRRRDGGLLDAQRLRETFAEASGITDDTLLRRLTNLGIGPDTLAALMLVPVVAVAWADGKMDDEERGSVLAAAADARLDVDGTGCFNGGCRRTRQRSSSKHGRTTSGSCRPPCPSKRCGP